MRYYLAIDIGASSGRHIVGWQEDGALQTKEVYRFPNGVHDQDGHLVWDIHSLYESIVNGIREAFKQYPAIESLSIDTWVLTMCCCVVTRRSCRCMPTVTAAPRL